MWIDAVIYSLIIWISGEWLDLLTDESSYLTIMLKYFTSLYFLGQMKTKDLVVHSSINQSIILKYHLWTDKLPIYIILIPSSAISVTLYLSIYVLKKVFHISINVIQLHKSMMFILFIQIHKVSFDYLRRYSILLKENVYFECEQCDCMQAWGK